MAPGKPAQGKKWVRVPAEPRRLPEGERNGPRNWARELDSTFLCRAGLALFKRALAGRSHEKKEGCRDCMAAVRIDSMQTEVCCAWSRVS